MLILFHWILWEIPKEILRELARVAHTLRFGMFGDMNDENSFKVFWVGKWCTTASNTCTIKDDTKTPLEFGYHSKYSTNSKNFIQYKELSQITQSFGFKSGFVNGIKKYIYIWIDLPYYINWCIENLLSKLLIVWTYSSKLASKRVLITIGALKIKYEHWTSKIYVSTKVFYIKDTVYRWYLWVLKNISILTMLMRVTDFDTRIYTTHHGLVLYSFICVYGCLYWLLA